MSAIGGFQTDETELRKGFTFFGSSFGCDASEPADGLDTRRLTKTQYMNVVRGLMLRSVPAAEIEDFFGYWHANVDGSIPTDSSVTYSTGDQNFSASHAIGFVDVADAVASYLSDGSHYRPFVNAYIALKPGLCVNNNPDSLDENCRKVLIRNFILRAFGRPIEENDDNGNNEMASYLGELTAAGSTSAAVDALIFKTMVAPSFLHQMQIDVQPSSGRIYKLSSYGVARRLSFIFTQTVPDETLLAMAEAKDLNEESAFKDALQYVVSHMDPTLNQFTSEWLHLGELPNYSDQDNAKFRYITPGLNTDNAHYDDYSLRNAMVAEVQELMSYVTKNNRRARELFTTNISFARHPVLLNIYKQATPAPAEVNEGNAVRFPADERSGLLTRAALLYSGGPTENLVLRGSHVRKNILCLSMPDPPPNLPAGSLQPPENDANLTTRQRYEHKTSGVSCVGCHKKINPAGYALSQYNAFGGYQPQEPIFENIQQPDGSWSVQLTKMLPTDPVTDMTQLQIGRTSQNAGQLSELIADSYFYKMCMTQNFYTFANGLAQRPDLTSSCSMNRMFQSLDNGGTMQDFFKSTVMDLRFRYRNLVR